MTFEGLTHTLPHWLNHQGPDAEIVVSSRVRLARNLSGYPFSHRASPEQMADVVNEVRDAAEFAEFDPGNLFLNDDLDELQRTVFTERHIISPALAAKSGQSGVLVKDSESSSIMVNEEDHIRLQAMRSGFDPEGALEEAVRIESKLSTVLHFAFSADHGYLTSCPTNMGTGLRASVLIHLPALVLTKEIQRVIRSASRLGMAVRGYYGEGSDVIGNLFQISNQTALGSSEEQIVDRLETVVKQVIEYERNAADMLMKEARRQLEDKVWRSVGILKTARVLSTHEFMNLSSAVRLGRFVQILGEPSLQSLNELMIFTQPGHIQDRIGESTEPPGRDSFRAEMVRERFVDVTL